MDAIERLYGNESLKRTVRGFASRDAFPSSLIISGEAGSGKTLAATLISMALSCRGENAPCGECEACRKIWEGISPDVITVTVPKDRKTIGIDAVREIKNGAYVLPNDLKNKVYIIKEAERMTEQAQNALLKLFEEGPSHTYFLLLTANPTLLLATVRSRAPELKTEVFDRQTLTELICRGSKKAAEMHEKDPVAFNRLINVSGGSYGRALELTESRSKKASSLHEKAESLISVLASDDQAELLSLLLSETADREKFTTLLRLTQTGLRDIVAVKRSGETELCLFASTEKASELAASFSVKDAIIISDVIDPVAASTAQTNINLRTAAVTLYCRLADRK